VADYPGEALMRQGGGLQFKDREQGKLDVAGSTSVIPRNFRAGDFHIDLPH
jgi:hypothetical protein